MYEQASAPPFRGAPPRRCAARGAMGRRGRGMADLLPLRRHGDWPRAGSAEWHALLEGTPHATWVPLGFLEVVAARHGESPADVRDVLLQSARGMELVEPKSPTRAARRRNQARENAFCRANSTIAAFLSRARPLLQGGPRGGGTSTSRRTAVKTEHGLTPTRREDLGGA